MAVPLGAAVFTVYDMRMDALLFDHEHAGKITHAHIEVWNKMRLQPCF